MHIDVHQMEIANVMTGLLARLVRNVRWASLAGTAITCVTLQRRVTGEATAPSLMEHASAMIAGPGQCAISTIPDTLALVTRVSLALPLPTAATLVTAHHKEHASALRPVLSTLVTNV